MNKTAYITKLALTTIPQIEIGFLWNLVLFFTGLVLLYFVSVFLLKRNLSKNEHSTIVLKKDIAPLISTLLFHSKRASRKEKEELVHAKVHLQELLKNHDHRKRISEILLNIQIDVSGVTRQRLIKIYKDYGLHHDAIKRLKSWRWEVVCRGIEELTQMQVTEAFIYIRDFVNDKRSIVRKQAQVATVVMKQEGINYFLDTAKHKISEWQQLRLIETMENLPEFVPPPFRLWLTSKNRDVVLFSLRLIRNFEQDDAMESLMKLVKHRDDKIKIEAVDCMRDFGFKEALPLFRAIFWNCRPDVKMALLTAIGELGSPVEIPFLRVVEQREVDFLVKSKAIATINALVPETILPSAEINESLDTSPDLSDLEVARQKNKEEKTDLDELHREFEASLDAPEFQKYKEIQQDEALAEDLMTKTGLEEISVAFEEVPLAEAPFSSDETVAMAEDELSQNSRLTKSAQQIRVAYSIIDTHAEIAARKDQMQIPEFNFGINVDEDLLQFVVSHDLTDLPDHQDDNGEENSSEKEHSAMEMKDSEGPQSFFEIGWTDDLGDSGENGLEAGPPDFDLELIPRPSENQDRSRSWLSGQNKPYSGGTGSYSSALEALFFASDTEGKLLLLEDILHLGDERDIGFLRKLRKDRSAAIRQAAEHMMQVLIQKHQRTKDPDHFEISCHDADPELIPEFVIDQEKTGIYDTMKNERIKNQNRTRAEGIFLDEHNARMP